MPSPFPGMDPFLEKKGIFHELHTQMLASAQRLLQPQLRPNYIARLERHLSEGSVWEMGIGSLHRKEPDVTVIEYPTAGSGISDPSNIATPTATGLEELDEEELELRKQRRIVIYVDDQPRLAVTSIELLSPTNKEKGSLGEQRYLEKRSSALHGGLNWVEIDLLRGGRRPPIPVDHPPSLYACYTARATETGWEHQVFSWGLRDRLPGLPVPLLGEDRAVLDVQRCFDEAYDAAAADTEAGYNSNPPPPPLSQDDARWVDELLRKNGLR